MYMGFEITVRLKTGLPLLPLIMVVRPSLAVCPSLPCVPPCRGCIYGKQYQVRVSGGDYPPEWN